MIINMEYYIWCLPVCNKMTLIIFPVCGQPTEEIRDFLRIFGGKDAPQNTIPWQVLLTVGSGRGGGIIIADKWIMTAAHVLAHKGQQVSKDLVKVSNATCYRHEHDVVFPLLTGENPPWWSKPMRVWIDRTCFEVVPA